ncbi:zinc ABC transporter ATP-binding protein AztA [Mycolicibacterium monacense]|uniref:ABC transporter related protein n=3 Tax=unclassified Mycobacterium TaxID=2642494 RepID=A0A5Q5BQQ8_MYCSS|nr:zinc ABC transporter ATP-binding protein AztA [Mycolicibacterium monacense]MDA4105236.1 ABC transporter [Mycolicibacterium monacense DSM 44395]OBB77195.1 ABC transporter [Mycolicibacterium monacense]OBF48412.1 ABC transporter [Mycolicibacterium monacense]ORB21681.1 ABC transporter [Mycolicibacterium monacense DSM 44395]QHP88452.1 ATP-binding cassette domain-containing protein [Mycolicibacterium monacense DSM 44395]
MKIIFNKSLPPTSTDAPIAVSGVDFGYPAADVFQGLNLSITRGALTAVTGSNGSGKSTLLGLLAGVLRPAGGVVATGTADVALAVQRSHLVDSFPITAAEAVMMGRWRRLGLLRRPTRADHAVVDRWLDEFGLTALRHRSVGELSGGQRQRVLLAQVFAQQATLLLLDEPTTGLDATTGALVIGHLRRLTADGTTVVTATHDPEVVRAADHRIDLGPLG